MTTIRLMFHTQEQRDKYLTSPVICSKDNAWLGEAYYFWRDVEDAHDWGKWSKKRTGYYEIYQAKIDCENVLDTVFNEKVYDFWLRQIESVAQRIRVKTGLKATLKELNEYFKERGEWDEVDGIMFEEVPKNENRTLVESFYYKKRIQLAVYNPAIISNFAFLKKGKG